MASSWTSILSLSEGQTRKTLPCATRARMESPRTRLSADLQRTRVPVSRSETSSSQGNQFNCSQSVPRHR